MAVGRRRVYVFARALLAASIFGVLALVGPAYPAPSDPTFGPAIDILHYEGQTKCSPNPKPGVVAFQQMVLREYPSTGVGGISRACEIGGQSEHKEGRAWDWSVSASDASDRAAVKDLFDWLLAEDRFGNEFARARRLGIMYMIWDKKIWGSWGGWEPYCVMKKGTCLDPEDKSARHPHTDHVHFSFTWEGARQKTTFWNPSRSYIAGIAGTLDGKGYWTAGRNGSVFPFGSAGWYGSKSDRFLKQPVVDMTTSPTGFGYWLTTRNGRVFALGDAVYKGRPKTKVRVAAIARTVTGKGYWLATRSGRVLEFGDAQPYGRLEETKAKVVDMAATPTGLGYWLFTDGGRVFAFGDARFFGGTANVKLKQPVVAAAARAGDGYWLVTSNGRVLPFGSARSHGGATSEDLSSPIVGMAATPTGEGYWLVTATGQVFGYGDARRHEKGQPQRRLEQAPTIHAHLGD